MASMRQAHTQSLAHPNAILRQDARLGCTVQRCKVVTQTRREARRVAERSGRSIIGQQAATTTEKNTQAQRGEGNFGRTRSLSLPPASDYTQASICRLHLSLFLSSCLWGFCASPTPSRTSTQPKPSPVVHFSPPPLLPPSRSCTLFLWVSRSAVGRRRWQPSFQSPSLPLSV